VTPDEIPDCGALRIWQKHNDQMLQDASTVDMMFSIPFLIEYISQGMTLLPGDVISTGTPPGIGSAREPQVLMKRGDFVETGVEGLGVQRAEVQ
jgi:2-keto-4-pentenoate hydratase/2-oxohepta-3-ene-1,7-dioic acid hydratase in catechol pathway